MGKRLRISKADLPDEVRGRLLGELERLFADYFNAHEKRLDCSDGRQNSDLLRKREREARFALGQTLEKLKLEDLPVAKNIVVLLAAYEKDQNVYSFKRVNNYIRQQRQSEEVKKIMQMAQRAVTPEDKAGLKKYLSSRPRREINGLIATAVQNYQRNRTDNNLLKVNKFLAIFNKRIVQKPYTKATPVQIRATRVDFSGYFNIPGRDDLAKYNPYSEFYQEFCKPRNRKSQQYDPFGYDLKNCPAWQAMEATANLAAIEMPLREQLGAQGIPPEKVALMNVNDFGRVLFNEYGKGYYNPLSGSRLYLKDVDPQLDSSHKEFFWKHNFLKDKETEHKIAQLLLRKGVSKSYIKVLFASIKKDGNPNPKVNKEDFAGIIPHFSLHHKEAIQYMGTRSNRQNNFVAIAEFEQDPEQLSDTPEHDIWHLADAVVRQMTGINTGKDNAYADVKAGEERASDFIEYLEDIRFNEQSNSNSWILSCGYDDEDNICAPVDEMKTARQAKASEKKVNRNQMYHQQETSRWAMI